RDIACATISTIVVKAIDREALLDAGASGGAAPTRSLSGPGSNSAKTAGKRRFLVECGMRNCLPSMQRTGFGCKRSLETSGRNCPRIGRVIRLPSRSDSERNVIQAEYAVPVFSGED